MSHICDTGLIWVHGAISAQMINLRHSKRGVPVLLIMPQQCSF